jgi:hypothetical protein
VLGVTQLNYLIIDNEKLSRENQALIKINERNVLHIAQIERELTDIRQVNDRNIEAKKKWRKATLLIGGIYVFTALIIYLQ